MKNARPEDRALLLMGGVACSQTIVMNSFLLTRSLVDRRLSLALAASAGLHVLVLASLHRLSPPARPSLQAIPIALVPIPGRGGGGDTPAAPPEPVAAAPPPPPPAPAPPRRRPAAPRVSRPMITVRLPAARDDGASAATSPTGQASTGAARASSTGGGGEGGGAGAAPGEARVAYGVNPLPPYPAAARRMGMEGVVLLEVIVAPDGRAREVRILRSSGHALLDEAAVSTVRARWRFIPARRGGVPVDSRADVPIRFRLTDDRG